MHKVIRVRLAHDPANPKEFKLGVGPCGREVIALFGRTEPEGIYIEQLCADGRKPNPRWAVWEGMLKEGHVIGREPPPHEDFPDTFFYPMAQVLEFRTYQTDTPTVCQLEGE